MVIILRRLVKQTICRIGISENWFRKTMAWRSSGTDNADLVNQLEGKLVHPKKKISSAINWVSVLIRIRF